MALQPFVGPWPLLRNVFYTDGRLIERVIIPSQGRYLHTGQHKHRINVHTDIHALSGIRTDDPSFRGRDDSSCLRHRGLLWNIAPVKNNVLRSDSRVPQSKDEVMTVFFITSIILSEVRLSPLGTAATIGLLYQP
jgi:hypothetical protein